MSLLKKIKKMAALTVIIIMSVNSANAQFYPVSAEMEEYGQQMYSAARSYFGRRSFSGYCGTYVRCQLRAMGIFADKFDVSGNGNQWYSNFENIEMTSGGYSVLRESGADCIKKLQEKYGDNLSNLVLSFPIQSGYSAAYPGAGHAMVIYELRDGIAYYTESFSFGQYPEGKVIAEDIDSLLNRYSKRHGTVTGCVMLKQKEVNSFIGNYESIVIAAIECLDNISMSGSTV